MTSTIPWHCPLISYEETSHLPHTFKFSDDKHALTYKVNITGGATQSRVCQIKPREGEWELRPHGSGLTEAEIKGVNSPVTFNCCSEPQRHAAITMCYPGEKESVTIIGGLRDGSVPVSYHVTFRTGKYQQYRWTDSATFKPVWKLWLWEGDINVPAKLCAEINFDLTGQILFYAGALDSAGKLDNRFLACVFATILKPGAFIPTQKLKTLEAHAPELKILETARAAAGLPSLNTSWPGPKSWA